MRIVICFATLYSLTACSISMTDTNDIAAIKNLMEVQKKAWSDHNLEAFMETYVKSDSLAFYSGGKLSYGWQDALDNYKHRYPTEKHTGSLDFTLHTISKINKDAYWVMGEYHLLREMGNANGSFMIILKRIDGEWKIVADSSC